ncbi:pilus assembly protein PilB [Rhizocola hellebori]|uniref:Pilus assembly protein PilB n=1 Tax=Rhizocola hellebori TaxID=1392758 RepID=A0A8J3Q7N9_9ACTN|nr:GspE/PulE family protein [Rhizocola hellebori]GIH05534.1 pilus assembly protein PilB [Rhizocola hellebori]
MKLGSRGRQPVPAAPEAPAMVAPRRPAEMSVHAGGQRLGEILVDAKLATAKQVVAALTASQRGVPRFLGEQLIEAGVLDERVLTAVVARQRRLELVDLREVTPSPQATALLDEAGARELLAIPLALRGDAVEVAVAFPVEGLAALLRDALGRPVLMRMATRSDILRAIGNSYRALTGIDSQVRAFEATHTLRRDSKPNDDASDDAPIVRVVQMIITQALRDRASDIHIEPHPERVLVRYRIDGVLHDVLDLPSSMGPVVVSRVKILAGLNIVERRRAQDGQISMEIEGRSVDIRVSTTAVIEGEKVVMRLLDKSRQLYRLPQLGMPPEMVESYARILRAPYGMVICAGPTGSGKTTTLYGSLGEINSPERNVMTIEDPVEYRIPNTNQIQIHEQAGITFAGGLRSILRQDPDVILVGEIRDVDTARIAVQAALTGHFVLSSLHATDTAAALQRLLDMGIEGFLIASSVTAVLSQRLVRRICEHCREVYQPPAEELALLRAIDGHAPIGGFMRGHGCNFCAQTGFLDRVGVYELMPVSDRIRELVVQRGSHDEILRVARLEGMRTLQQEAARLVESGVTTPAEVLRSIYVLGT